MLQRLQKGRGPNENVMFVIKEKEHTYLNKSVKTCKIVMKAFNWTAAIRQLSLTSAT